MIHIKEYMLKSFIIQTMLRLVLFHIFLLIHVLPHLKSYYILIRNSIWLRLFIKNIAPRNYN